MVQRKMEDIKRLSRQEAMRGGKSEETIQALLAKKAINRESVLEYGSAAEMYMDVEEDIERTENKSSVFIMFTLGGKGEEALVIWDSGCTEVVCTRETIGRSIRGAREGKKKLEIAGTNKTDCECWQILLPQNAKQKHKWLACRAVTLQKIIEDLPEQEGFGEMMEDLYKEYSDEMTMLPK